MFKSKDIEKEALMDIKLIEQGIVKDMDWVFLSNGSSGPLESLLKSPITRPDGSITTLMK